MSVPKHSASATADEQVHTGSGKLMGWTISETATTPAAAEVILRDGTGATDPIIAHYKLAAGGHATESHEPVGVRVNTGVYVDRVSGTSAVTVYIS